MALTAPIAGRIVDRIGPRVALSAGLALVSLGAPLLATTRSEFVFALGFGVIAAVGFGVVALHNVSTAVAMLLSEKRGLAAGEATSGSTAGQLLVVPLVAVLLMTVSWRRSFGGLALIAAIGVVAGLIMLPTKPRTTKGKSASSKKNAGKPFRSPVYHMLFWSFVLCGFTSGGIIETHLFPFSACCGFPPLPSTTAYGVLSAVSLFVMILAGYLSDHVNTVLLLASICALKALTFVILIMLSELGIEWLFIFALLFSLVDYSTVSVTACLVASHLVLKVMGLAMGLLAAGHTLGAAAGAVAGD